MPRRIDEHAVHSASWSVRAVLFDLDETLHDRTETVRGFLQTQHRRFGGALGGASIESFTNKFLALDARGSVPKTIVYEKLLHELGGDPSMADSLIADFRAGYPLHAVGAPDMAETLTVLRERGFKLGIVSNGQTELQNRKIDILGLRPLVVAVLVSEAEGIRKPDPRIFHRAAERVGADPRDCVFVGDNPEADVLGALDAGMKAVWFSSGRAWPNHLSARPSSVVIRLRELLNLTGPA
jgi:putative hydrolase of the HAD superfamily